MSNCDKYKCRMTCSLAFGISFLVATTVVFIVTGVLYLLEYMFGSGANAKVFLFPLLLLVPPLIDFLVFGYYKYKNNKCKGYESSVIRG